jgi:hypothetical protein
MNQLKSNLASSPASEARLDKDQFAGPLRREHVHRLDDGATSLDGAARVLKQHALTVALGQDNDSRRTRLVFEQRESR